MEINVSLEVNVAQKSTFLQLTGRRMNFGLDKYVNPTQEVERLNLREIAVDKLNYVIAKTVKYHVGYRGSYCHCYHPCASYMLRETGIVLSGVCSYVNKSVCPSACLSAQKLKKLLIKN